MTKYKRGSKNSGLLLRTSTECSDQVGIRGGYSSLQKGKANIITTISITTSITTIIINTTTSIIIIIKNSSKNAIFEKGEHSLEKAGSVEPRWMGLA